MTWALLLEAMHAPALVALGWIAAALLHGTLLALLTLAIVRGPLRALHPGIHGILWLFVLVKFLLPVGPGWSLSLFTAVSAATARLSVAAPLPAAPRASAAPTEPLVLHWVTPHPSPVTSVPEVSAATAVSWWAAGVAALYLAGFVVVAVRRGVRHAALARRCTQLPCADGAVVAVVAAACARLGLRRIPDVRISDAAPAPFILGVRRPTLVLSRRQLGDAAELEAVIFHELAHVRRGDLLVRYVQWLAGTVFYFWPVVAWVNRRIDLVREFACDEWALRHGRLSAGEYARCLLRAAGPVRAPLAGFGAAAMAASPSNVERRIDMILHASRSPRSSRFLGLAAGVLLAGWGVFVLSGAATPSTPQDSPPSADPAQPVEPEDRAAFVRELIEGRPVPVLDRLMRSGAAPGALALSALAEDHSGAAFGFGQICFTDGGADAPALVMSWSNAPSVAALKAFLAEHPTADADADGALTPIERDAYLVALAMSDPGAVLARYPKADADGDGSLSAAEAARWITGPPVAIEAPRFSTFTTAPGPQLAADGGAIITCQAKLHVLGDKLSAAGPDGQAVRSGVRVVKIMRSDGEQTVEVTTDPGDADLPGAWSTCGESTAALADGKSFHGKVAFVGDAIGAPPAVWLPRNIAATPAARDVARYVPVVSEAPLAAFLAQNPDADANADGKLTADERDAFIAARMARVREKALEKFPAADKDGDGVLSQEEFEAHLQAMARESLTTLTSQGAELRIEAALQAAEGASTR